MIGLLLKKFLYDLWDNLFNIIVINFGFLLFVILGFLLPAYLPEFIPVWGVFCLLGILVAWLFIYLCATAAAVKEVSDFRRLSLAGFLSNIKSAIKPAFVLLTVFAFVVYMLVFTVPLYFRMGSLIGTAAGFLSCWLCLFLIGAIQFYPAVYFRLGMRPIKCIKKCVIIFLDNTAFCMGALIFNVIIFVPLILFPSLPLLYLDEALRLRLYKYDYLDARAAERQESRYDHGWRKVKIPWDELLEEERDKVGDRSFRSFIFPWKD